MNPIEAGGTLLLIAAPGPDSAELSRLLQEATGSPAEVVVCRTLHDGLDHLAAVPVDCVVVDLALPDAGGLGAVRALVALPSAPAVIVLTGEDDPTGPASLLAGASDYLTRETLARESVSHPIRYAILRKRLETSLAEAQALSQTGSWDFCPATGEMTWSSEMARILGLPPEAEPSLRTLLSRIHPEDRAATIKDARRQLTDAQRFELVHRVVRSSDGSVRWVKSQGRVETRTGGRQDRLLVAARDITERKEIQDQLVHQTRHDPLTGLPNRMRLLDRMTDAIERLDGGDSVLGLIYCDVDRFKVVNDSLGHSTGDQILVALGERLSEALRPGDTLARVSGDEFAVLCEGLKDRSEALEVAGRIQAGVAGPLRWRGGTMVVTLSAGVAFAEDASVSPATLLDNADAAMYHAKQNGSGRLACYSEEMRERSRIYLQTELDLREALVRDQLRLFYQPVVRLVDGVTVGHEALIRWEHPVRGLLSPADFIQIAEETGLIVPVGQWVLREACRQAKKFQAIHPEWSGLTMAVNISGSQFMNPDLPAEVSGVLEESGLDPRSLILEITESMLMENAATTVGILRKLKQLGVGLSVDDFGTGYSSLSYLKRLPVDILKVDRTFVADLGRAPSDSAIVAAILNLAKALNLTVVAEGIETTEQMDHLVRFGCELAQGFLLSRPMAAVDAGRLLLDSVLSHRPAQVPDRAFVEQNESPAPYQNHVAHYYAEDVDLIGSVTEFLHEGLLAGESVLAVTTPAHGRALEAALAGRGCDLSSLRRDGRLRVIDAYETVELLVENGEFRHDAFVEMVRGNISELATDRRVRLFGEMAALLWDRNQVTLALELEMSWASLLEAGDLSVFCGQRLGSLTTIGTLDEVCNACGSHLGLIVAPRTEATSGAAPPWSHRAGPGPDSDSLHRVIADATRGLIWADTVADIEKVVGDLVREMGGSLVSADDTGRGTIPLNLRLDGGPPMAPSAPADSVAHMLIERHLPAFMQDALRAAALLGQRRQADKELARDPLTGVANRRRLTASLAAMRPGEALVILDLDHFKEVNDTFGHPAGDELLKTFARFLQATVGDLGTVGRYGGEEFLILLRAPADPDGVCSMLREAWRSRGAWRAGERPPVTFSAGWAGVDERSNSRAALQAADAALYRAKARGRDQACGPVEEFAA